MKKTKRGQKGIRNYIIVGIFLALLYLPVLIYPFVKGLLSEDNSDGSKSITFPKLGSIHDVVKFPAEFDNYWSNNLPFKDNIQQAYADLSFLFFRTSFNDGIVVGESDGDWRDAWLFYNYVKDGDPFGDVRGTKRLTMEQKQNALKNILSNTKKMKEQGIDLYYFVAPNKSTVYKDKLPGSVNVVNDVSLMNDLNKYLLEQGINNFLYVEDDMKAEREKNGDDDIKYPLYRSLDTHWNDYGAFIGTKSLIKMIEPSFTGYDSYHVELDGDINSGDLKSKANIGLSLRSPAVTVRTEHDRFGQYELIADLTKDINHRVNETIKEDAPIKKKVLIIGYSYRLAMIPWMSSVFSDVVYVHHDTYKADMIERFDPDIIVLEAVERYAMLNMAMVL